MSSSATLMEESTPSLTAQSESDIISFSDMDDDTSLSQEQVDALLARAESNLRERQRFLQKISTTRTISSPSMLPKLNPGQLPAPYLRSSDKVVKPEARGLVSDEQRLLASKTRKIDDPVTTKQRKEIASSSGLSTHFDLPRTKMTPELKRDMQLLHMRAVLDPKRMYKKQGKFKIPEYSQMGVIVEGATEFFSARLNNKDRKLTFVDEALDNEAETGRFKRKYEEVQAKHRSGKKAFYKELKARRKGKKG